MAACLTSVGVVVGEQYPSFSLSHGHVMVARDCEHSKRTTIMKSKLCSPSSIKAQVAQVAQNVNLGVVLRHRLLQPLQYNLLIGLSASYDANFAFERSQRMQNASTHARLSTCKHVHLESKCT